MNYRDFFGCQYPVVAAPMNQVSDLKLALACSEAGIFPSLSLYNQIENGRVSLRGLVTVLNRFQDKTGSNRILVSLTTSDFMNPVVQPFILNNSVTHLEIIDDKNIVKSDEWSEFLKTVELFKNNNVKVILKALDANNVDNSVDAIMLKGGLGAGRGRIDINIADELLQIKKHHPTVPVIVAGGVGTCNDLKNYLSLGSMSVAVGTLLAASEESCISRETKEKMIAATYNDVKRINEVQQNALVFSSLEDDDYNNTKGLAIGMRDPTKGHVFAGKSIDQITEIRPVKDIINDLVKDLE